MGGEAMTETEMAEFVRQWFGEAGQADGPLLPDSWHGGRVREGTFFLHEVHALDDSLIIRLSEETTLSFEGLRFVSLDNSDIVFDGFRRATLRWRQYGGGPDAPICERSYKERQIRLAAPIGTTVRM